VRPLRRDVLHERAAQGDVEDLDATADRERGQRASAGRLDERDLERVAPVVGVAQLGVRRTPVATGAHVLAAGEDETSHAVQRRVGVGRVEDRSTNGSSAAPRRAVV
jgi:hypothetical protein